MLRRAHVVAVLATVLTLSSGWAPTRIAPSRRTSVLSLSVLSSSFDTLGGVQEFEEWFTTSPGASCRPSLQHASFGSLRGLTFTEENGIKENTHALTIPDKLVLSAPISDPNWDVQLAQQLWTECLKGRKSDIHGYCALLTLGTLVDANSCPPSTAHNALRHWTDAQRQLLGKSVKGSKLLGYQKEQELQWKSNYACLQTNMTWQQFEWAMEVVHSRAFCGTFGNAPSLFAAAPVLAGAIGYTYWQNNPEPSDLLLFGLAILGALPVLVTFASPEQERAVLLPLIDSANHLETADSSIEYNPLTREFTLNVGPKCLVEEEGGKTQLYISYGKKSDAELLNNYGFLPGISCSDGENEAAQDSQRTRLAEAFIQRNP